MERTNDNAVLREYFEACEEIKRLEAVKEGCKAHILKLVPRGKMETKEYVATISNFTEKRVASNQKDVSAVEALIGRFGSKAMKPFVKTNKVRKITVSRKSDAEEKVVLTHGGKKLEFT